MTYKVLSMTYKVLSMTYKEEESTIIFYPTIYYSDLYVY
jgi:hypothetical protein